MIPVDRELRTIPTGSPFTITVTNTPFDVDNGVSYTTGALTGAMLLKVTAGPSTGQYTVNVTSGVYTFASVDNSLGVAISYTYSNATRGKTITLTNQVMGFAPTCRMDVWANFRNKILGIRLNACTLGQWTYPSKLEDFWISDVTFDANTDASDTLGKIFADVF